MFTGIITDIGRIETVERGGDPRLRIACGHDLANVELGASIACSGVCLTVVDKGEQWFAVNVSAETLARTAAGMWEPGRALNLERALKLGDELGGHIVTGHVDDVAEVVALEPVGDSLSLTLAAPLTLAPFLASKGSVALDGVSLTVNRVVDQPSEGTVEFEINLIPHTIAHTNLAGIETGRRLNVEIDILARYIGRMMDARATAV